MARCRVWSCLYQRSNDDIGFLGPAPRGAEVPFVRRSGRAVDQSRVHPNASRRFAVAANGYDADDPTCDR